MALASLRLVTMVLIAIRSLRVEGFFIPTSNWRTSQPNELFAKKVKKTKHSKKQKPGQQRNKSFPNGGAPPQGLATNVKPVSVAGVSEDHAYEQFFYDENCRHRLFKIVKEYSYPLLVCNPSLAVIAEEEKHPYMLLDRDKRFNFLKKYREFDVLAPFLVPPSYKYDAIFVDPPFANVTPAQLARCLKMMAPNSDRASVPVYIAYNSDREKELIDAFAEGYDGPRIERKWSLEYQSCTEKTNDKIWLYGPQGPYPC